ncbi:glycosyltransferase family 2 protein [Roseomonas marmotae]|uniref:Glycosyltransferase family 2 protein n=1 Tax=Roseomonas marmotae TaxID=2768161 RepID=A0ABS3KFP7_9PROT|nr:glycosyltransferase family A protein [Roseomonas marmotae]MBO1075468.1 glycosyltransferase family 2 protein [Roseomonas marmotae]QTI81417.1 glycosyltransferase family 2 protein [Roseomonas marmotae]
MSVVIPAFNSANTLGRTIRSVLSQTVPPLEIIVVDDGSADDTAAVAAAFGPCVRVIRKLNGGPASARNLGVSHARGRWIAFLDADDQWGPAKLERQLPYTIPDDVGLVHTLIDDRADVPEVLDFDLLWRRNWIANSTVLIRRDVFLALGGFDEARELISVEDYNLWVRLAASGWKIVLCPEILTDYTRGVGISSNMLRFFDASLYNARALSDRLSLSPTTLKHKLAEICLDFGKGAIYRRDMPMARKFIIRSMKFYCTKSAVFHFGAALMPAVVLDLRRVMLRLVQGDRPVQKIRIVQVTATAAYGTGCRSLSPENQDDVVALFNELAQHLVRSRPSLFGQDVRIRDAISRIAWDGYLDPRKLRRKLRYSDRSAWLSLESTEIGYLCLRLLSAVVRESASVADQPIGVGALQMTVAERSRLMVLRERLGTSDEAEKAYQLAVMICQRRASARISSSVSINDASAALLRDIIRDIRHALKDIRFDFGNADALYLWKLAEEISQKKAYLWIDALLLADQLGRAGLQNEVPAKLVPDRAIHAAQAAG